MLYNYVCTMQIFIYVCMYVQICYNPRKVYLAGIQNYRHDLMEYRISVQYRVYPTNLHVLTGVE